MVQLDQEQAGGDASGVRAGVHVSAHAYTHTHTQREEEGPIKRLPRQTCGQKVDSLNSQCPPTSITLQDVLERLDSLLVAASGGMLLNAIVAFIRQFDKFVIIFCTLMH